MNRELVMLRDEIITKNIWHDDLQVLCFPYKYLSTRISVLESCQKSHHSRNHLDCVLRSTSAFIGDCLYGMGQ